jgi:GNAT superfamily N-acetyltransferase
VSLRIRPAEPEDAADVARIYIDSWNAGFGHLMEVRPVVDPGAWCSGVGRALMTTAIDALAAAGYRRAILWTVDGYERGHRFYESQGWVRDGRWRDEGRQVAYGRALPDPSAEAAQSGSSA